MMVTTVKTITVRPSLSAFVAKPIISFVSFSVSPADFLVSLVESSMEVVSVAVLFASFRDSAPEFSMCFVITAVCVVISRDFCESMTLLCLYLRSTRVLSCNNGND